MENINIAEMVSTLGFPIVICIALCYFIYKLWQQSVTREEKLMTEITENRLVNEKAVETIAKFAERFSHIEEDVTEIKNDVVLIKDKLNS